MSHKMVDGTHPRSSAPRENRPPSLHVRIHRVDSFSMEAVRTSPSADRKGWNYLSPLDERRVSSRERVVARGLISERASRYGGETEGQIVEVSDLTLHGLGFCAPVAFEVGALHNVLVMAGPLRLSSRFRVVSCRASDQIGQFDIGGQFC